MTLRARAATVSAVLLLATGLGGGSLSYCQSATEREIAQAQKAIEVDGKLDDWAGVPELALDKTPEGKTLMPSADLTASARLTFDAENLYAAVRVVDSEIVFPERGLREGDSIFITLVDPDPQARGRRYSTWGFARSRGEDIKVLVSRNGKAYPQAFVKDIQLKIQPGADHKSLVYEIAIPWRYVPDFRPFIGRMWGVNFACADYDQKSRKTVELTPDASFEDDITGPRRGMPFRFVTRVPQASEFQAQLNANHYFLQDEKILNLAVNSPAARSGWGLRFQLSSASGNVQIKKDLSFGPGLSVIGFPVEIAKPETGTYDFSVGVLDEKGALRFSEDEQFFLLEKPEVASLAAKVEEIKKGAPYAKDKVLRESLSTLELRLKWTEDFMKSADAFGDIESLERWNEETKELMRLVEMGKPALFPTGRPVVLGYRSPVDGTLKSYAAVVPDFYDPKLRFPLYVTLGGGGVEAEREASIVEAANGGGFRTAKKAGDMIVLAVDPSLASNWYAGDSAREILASIEHIQKLYSVNGKAVIIDGFDKGAYGALRLALLNPGVFLGVVLRSGRYTPPESSGAEALAGLLERAKGLRAIILHGDADEIAPVAEARALADSLTKAAGPSIRLVEVKAGEHLIDDRWPDILGWVKNAFGGAVVRIKPPRRPGEKRGQENPGDPEGHDDPRRW